MTPRKKEEQFPSRVEHLRQPPHSEDSEQAVLGGLMLDERALTKICDWIKEEDFYRRDHRLIFRAISELSTAGKPCDAVTMGEWFEAQGVADMIGGANYVIQLANSTPSAANITAYAEIVREKARLRDLITIGTDMVSKAFAPYGSDTSSIASGASLRLGDLIGDPRGGGLETVGGAVRSWMARMHERYERGPHLSGLATPFGQMNDMTQGLQPGDTIVIAARPGMGKTVLLENIARFNALAGNATAIFSLEMSKEALIQRGVSAMSGVPHERLRRAWEINEEQWPLISEATSRLVRAPYSIDAQPGLTPQQIVARAKRLHLRKKLTLVGIDHLGRVRLPNKANKADEVGDALKYIQGAAKECGWVLVILNQLNRGLLARTDTRPNMGDLRASGAIEEDADQIYFMHRQEYFEPATHLKGVVELIPAKGRDFQNNKTIHLQNHYENMMLSDWVGDLPAAPAAAPKRSRGLKANGVQAHMPYIDK